MINKKVDMSIERILYKGIIRPTSISGLNFFFGLYILVAPEWQSCERAWHVKPGAKNAMIKCKAWMSPEHKTSTWVITKNGSKNKNNRTLLVDIDEDDKKQFKADFKVIEFTM